MASRRRLPPSKNVVHEKLPPTHRELLYVVANEYRVSVVFSLTPEKPISMLLSTQNARRQIQYNANPRVRSKKPWILSHNLEKISRLRPDCLSGASTSINTRVTQIQLPLVGYILLLCHNIAQFTIRIYALRYARSARASVM